MALASRGMLAGLALVSWLTLSNHCALGLATADAHASAEMTIHHDCCTSDVPMQSNPEKKQSANPCCKTLQAVSVAPAKVLLGSDVGLIHQPISPWVMVIESPEPPALSARFLDSGPPFSESLAESVFQRSILAHAPPLSLV